MLLERETLHGREEGTQAKDVSTGDTYVWTGLAAIRIYMNPLSLTGAGNVYATANAARSILLSHNFTEPGVNYKCNVTEMEGQVTKEVNNSITEEVMNVTIENTNVTGLLPDTTYRVDCVAYHSDGVEYCLEANTTVTTRELYASTLEQNKGSLMMKLRFLYICRPR